MTEIKALEKVFTSNLSGFKSNFIIKKIDHQKNLVM